MPARRANITPPRWPTVPLPGWASETACGFAFAAATRSASVRSGDFADTTTTRPWEAIEPIGARSLSGSNGIFA